MRSSSTDATPLMVSDYKYCTWLDAPRLLLSALLRVVWRRKQKHAVHDQRRLVWGQMSLSPPSSNLI